MSEQGNNKTVNQALIYGIAIILQHMASIVMLPIYTRFLTPADYGVAELLSMGVEFIGLILGVVSAEAMFRFYYDSDNENYRKSVVCTAFILSLAFNCVGFLIILSFPKFSKLVPLFFLVFKRVTILSISTLT